MAAVRFSVLGPMEATRDGVRVPIPGGRIRTLLAALLLRPNQVVSVDQLVERMWGEEPPRNPRRVLQTNVVRLRRSLDLGKVIATEPGGYAARLAPDQLDLLTFQRLLGAAAGTPGPLEEARLLRAALELWRGPVCAGVESDTLRKVDVPPLVEQRLRALERRIDLDVMLGGEAGLVTELRALTAEHPLRERLWAQLMTILLRTGRHAEALEAYHRVSRLLREGLGVDPGAELRRLHQDALIGRQEQPGGPVPHEDPLGADPADLPEEGEPSLADLVRTWRQRALLTQEQLAVRAGLNARTIRRLESGELRRPRNASVRLVAAALGLDVAELSILTRAAGVAQDNSPLEQVIPRQLPADVAAFVGRARELAVLDEAGDRDTVTIMTIDGMAGVGKTALAVHAAHRLAPYFPDGSLFVDLHGHTEGMAAADPSGTLARVLGVLGVPGESIPQHADDRAALYRTVLSGRKMLIVLDNAADEAQVRPLLPGAGGSLVLVTSRRRLVGLDGVRTVTVDVLPPADAVALFARTVGDDRLAGASAEELAEVVRRCGLLPLAIRLAAARLKAHPAWTVGHLLERLDEHDQRLRELHGGQRSVAVALDLSYAGLDAAERRAYRLLGLHPGVDVAPDAAAALLDTTPAAAAALLDRLLEIHLLQEPAPGRYRFHNLVRAHAIAAATGQEPADDRGAALARLLDHYSRSASAAMDILYPYEADTRPRVSPGAAAAPAIADAGGWLEAELPNLLALARYAAEHGFPEHVRHLSATLHRCLRTRGRYADAGGLHLRALSSARADDDREGEMEALISLAEIHTLQGRHQAAAADATRAADLARAAGHRSGELRALVGLGFVHLERVELKQAVHCYTRALEIARAIGHRTGELDALIGCGHAHRVLGRHQPAIDHLTRALDLARTIGHHTGESRALIGLGYLHLKPEKTGPAAVYFTRALALARDTGYRVGELSSLTALGDLHHMQGRHEQARACFQQIADLARRIGNRNWQYEAVQSMGRLHHDSGDYDRALDHHRQALALAADLDQPADQARAHDGLARAHAALGRPDPARHHWHQALIILTSLGIDETEERGVDVTTIRGRLGSLAPANPPEPTEP